MLQDSSGCLLIGTKTYNKDKSVKIPIKSDEGVLSNSKDTFAEFIKVVDDNGVYEGKSEDKKDHPTDGLIFNAQLIITEEFEK
jgi:hypothetical protein